MRTRIFKFFLPLFLIFISTGFNNTKKLPVCGGGGAANWYNYYGNHFYFFEPITFDKLVDYSNTYFDITKDNTKEWQNFFGAKIEIEDIIEVVYRIELDTLKTIKEQVLNDKIVLDKKFENNSLIKHWQATKESESLDYLIFAKQCEPLVIGSPSAWSYKKVEINAQVANEMIAEAQKKYKKTKSDFLKLRFAYQIIRLAHYSKQYQKTVNLYEKLVEPLFKNPSIMKYWAMEHKAGALSKIGKVSEASYWFSIVFAECPSRRSFSFNSFRINTDRTWNDALKHCKTPQEKSNFHFIRALQDNADILAEMKDMYKHYPESKNLERLLVRLMKDFEGNFLSYYVPYNLLLSNITNNEQEEQLDYLIELQNFLSKINQAKNTRKPYFWICAEAYTYFLRNKHSKALEILNSTEYETPKAKKTKKVLELAMRLGKLDKIDNETEIKFHTEVKKTNHRYLKSWMLKKFAKLYLGQNEEAKAFLALRGIQHLRLTTPLELVDKILVWLDKDMNTFEKEVLLKSLGETPFENVKELKATILFGQNKLEEAIKIYETLSKTKKLPADPFKANLNDCLDCDRYDNPTNIYTKLSLAKKLLSMQKQAEKEQNPETYFDLAVAFYNMTYFGNTWDANQYARGGSDLWYYNYSKNSTDPVDYKVNYNFDCSQASYYFNKALYLAEQNKNKELAAKASFFAAKCEQNNYYQSDVFDDSWKPKHLAFDVGYGTYFKKLKEYYSDTKFYQEALEECFYLKMYDAKF